MADISIFPGMWVRTVAGDHGYGVNRAGRVMRLANMDEAIVKFDAWPMPMQVPVASLVSERAA